MKLTVTEQSQRSPNDPCAHCGQPLGESPVGIYCCTGCEAARALIESCDLSKYYDLRGEVGAPVDNRKKASDPWLEELAQKLSEQPEGVSPVSVDIQGMHCAACVWLIERLFEKLPGSKSILINPGAGTIRMLVNPKVFDIRTFVTQVRSVGYQLGPAGKQETNEKQRSLLLRLGVCAALSMNVMLFAIPLYFGLFSGPLFEMMRTVAWVLTTAAVLIGGSVFIQSAYRSLRLGVAHLDQPIALGIILAYSGSSYSIWFQQGQAAYLDTVTVFITLMLLGRLLQERSIDANRRGLLADSGIDRVDVRLIREGTVKVFTFGDIRQADQILWMPGEFCPVECEALAPTTHISLEWITGESASKSVTQGETIPAGSILLSEQPVLLQSKADFAHSKLVSLLASTDTDTDMARATRWWRLLTRYYVMGVLAVSSLGGLGWYLSGAGVHRALEITVAILVVTCPCAFGIATPLAYEIVQTGLRKKGTWIRSARFLDRASDVRKIVFDKTGTLTLGDLELANPEKVNNLSDEEREVLWNMVVRSSHPKSNAIRKELAKNAPMFRNELSVEQVPGQGIETNIDQHVWRLGSASFAGSSVSKSGGLYFSRDGVVIGDYDTHELPRSDAPKALRELRQRGYQIHLLSGDSTERVREIAQTLGIEPNNAKGSATPEEKEKYLESLDSKDTMMVGDGVNDVGAIRRAWCSITPATDLPFLPSRADVSIRGPLVFGVDELLRKSHILRSVVRRTLMLTTFYNFLTVSLSLAGLMSPLLCAAVMPSSSLSVVFFVVWSLRRAENAEQKRLSESNRAAKNAVGGVQDTRGKTTPRQIVAG